MEKITNPFSNNELIESVIRHVTKEKKLGKICHASLIASYFDIEYKCNNINKGLFCRTCNINIRKYLLRSIQESNIEYFKKNYQCTTVLTHKTFGKSLTTQCSNIREKGSVCKTHYCNCIENFISYDSFMTFIIIVKKGYINNLVATYFKKDLFQMIHNMIYGKRIISRDGTVHFAKDIYFAKDFIKEYVVEESINVNPGHQIKRLGIHGIICPNKTKECKANQSCCFGYYPNSWKTTMTLDGLEILAIVPQCKRCTMKVSQFVYRLY